MKATSYVSSCVALLFIVPLSQCQQRPMGQRAAEERPPPPAAAAPPEREKPAPSSALPSPAGREEQNVEPGQWIDSASYKFKISSLAECGKVEAAGDAAPPPDDRPLRVGVGVHVLAKYDGLFVSGRDVTFEKNGVIVNSEIDAKSSAGCTGLLRPKTLQHDQTTGGVVIFQLPDEAFARSGIVAFQPTRWGGAPRVEVKARDLTLLAERR